MNLRRFRGLSACASALVLSLLGAACAGPSARGEPGIQVRWELEPSPPGAGPTDVLVRVADDAWRPLNGLRVILSARLGDAPLQVDTARGEGAGRYRGTLHLGAPGAWTLTARVERSGRWSEVDHRVTVDPPESERPQRVPSASPPTGNRPRGPDVPR